MSAARIIHALLLLAVLAGGGWGEPLENAIGNWKIFHGGGEPIFVRVSPGGVAHFRGDGGVQGTWKLVNGCLQLSWQDGWRDVIIQRGRVYRKLGYAPGRKLQGPPDHETPAYRIP